jgi:hypothetical protein
MHARTQWTPPPQWDVSTSSPPSQISVPVVLYKAGCVSLNSNPNSVQGNEIMNDNMKMELGPSVPQVQLSRRQDDRNSSLFPGHEGNVDPNETELTKNPESVGAIAGGGQAGTGKERAAHKKLFKWNSPIEQEFIYSPPSSQSPQSRKSESPSSTVFRASPGKGKGNREGQLHEEEEAEEVSDGDQSEIQQWLRMLRKSGGGDSSAEAEAIEQAARSLGLRSIEVDGRREIRDEEGAAAALLEVVSAVDTPPPVRKHCCLVLANVTLDR